MKIKTTTDVTYFDGEQVKTGKIYATILDAGFSLNFNNLSFGYRLYNENDNIINQGVYSLLGDEIDVVGAKIDAMNYMIPQEFTERQKNEYRFAIILKLKFAEQFSISLNDIEIVFS